MLRPYIFFIVFVCLVPTLAQDAETRNILSNALPNTFANRLGTMAFDYPDGWRVSASHEDNFNLQKDNPNSDESSLPWEYFAEIRPLGTTEMSVDLANYFEAEFLSSNPYENYLVEEVLIDEQYAVIGAGASFHNEHPTVTVTVLRELQTGLEMRVSVSGTFDDIETVHSHAIDIAASLRLIDPEILDIDTDGLMQTYEGRGMQFNYPETYFIHEVDKLIILESADYTEYEQYRGRDYQDFMMPWVIYPALVGDYRVAIHRQSRADMAALLETGNFYFEDVYRAYLERQESFYFSDLENQKIVWSETSGMWIHQSYLPNTIKMLFEVEDADIIFFEGHSFGFNEMYPLRRLILNILSTIHVQTQT